jgi:putative MATE family efflux protein
MSRPTHSTTPEPLAPQGDEEVAVAAPVTFLRRSPYDRDIARLAALAVGALAAEPLYVLVDTAIVGHLGRAQLAALGIAGVALATVVANFNFLVYGTTAQVGRADAVGERAVAHRLGLNAVWLSLGLGVATAVAVFALARPVVELMGGQGETADFATTYLRISALGLPFAFLVFGGQGYLRGISNLRTPLLIIVGGNAANAVLEVLFVYAFGWGIIGSAASTVIAQAGMGVSFVAHVLGRERTFAIELALMGRLLQIGGHIFVRTSSLHAALLIAAAVIARFGDASIAAHQITFGIWVFLALVLDAVAIAGHVIISRRLGAGDTAGAFAAAARMIGVTVLLGVAFAAGLLALATVLPELFTDDAAVVEKARDIWPVLLIGLPVSSAVYALDGILIGAGDVRFLMWAMLIAAATSVALALAALALNWGIVGVWLALLAMNGVRLATLTVRFIRRRWLVTGWA